MLSYTTNLENVLSTAHQTVALSKCGADWNQQQQLHVFFFFCENVCGGDRRAADDNLQNVYPNSVMIGLVTELKQTLFADKETRGHIGPTCGVASLLLKVHARSLSIGFCLNGLVGSFGVELTCLLSPQVSHAWYVAESVVQTGFWACQLG